MSCLLVTWVAPVAGGGPVDVVVRGFKRTRDGVRGGDWFAGQTLHNV